jgi:1,5-anhydro-D-fructose reductase (1,5-anhydro-D-mannitol-forming)
MKWGLVGTGGIAAKALVPGAFGNASNAELAGVLSSDADKAKEFAKDNDIPLGTADLEELLGVDDIEAIWIASPTHLHHEQASAALAAGKHVLLEKPLAMDPQQGWDLVAKAKEADRLLATGYQARYVPGHIEMKKLIAEGAVGEVIASRTWYGIHRPGPPPEWRQNRDTAHWGALADVGTHHIDLLRMLLGEIKEGKAYYAKHMGFETDDCAAAALELEAGSLATLTISSNVWAESTRVEVHGTGGALVAVDTSPRGQGTVTLLQPDKDPQDVTGETPLSFLAQLETLTRVFGGEDIPYATGEDGARNLEILEQLVP